MLLTPVLTLLASATLPVASAWATHHHATCRCFPGDDCWPTEGVWRDFNMTLGGKLVATVPLAAPCHDSRFAEYNATECELLQDGWTLPQTQQVTPKHQTKLYNSSSSVMAPFFANRSCDPFTGENAQCVTGTYISYAVAIQSAEEVRAALHFAQQHNIRIVIRNSGHDYNGKSTGAGALGIWTHHLKSIDIFSYRDDHYHGKAMKLGAGVQGFEAYAAAHQQNLAVVGGECPTVGIAGGYTQGGGHSALASKYGMAADQVLAWEVVDAKGHHLNATRLQNSDLFWALSGGGGGTYGVVLSMTVKAHPDMPTAGGNLSFTAEGLSQEEFWSTIETYHQVLPSIVDEGIMSLSYFSNSSFSISPMTGPGVSAARMNELLLPFTNKLDSLRINYTKLVLDFPDYHEAFSTMFYVIEVGVAQYGGRLVSRSAVQQNSSALTEAYRSIVNNDGGIAIVALNVSKAVAGDVDNAVNPVWREALLDTVISTPWDFSAPWSEMQARADKMTEVFVPALTAVTPGGGTYLNEADFQDPDWKENYYGVNYDRLLEIKNKYDPDHVFYALTAVGSDYWEPQADGRLCVRSS